MELLTTLNQVVKIKASIKWTPLSQPAFWIAIVMRLFNVRCRGTATLVFLVSVAATATDSTPA
jgi:hypothetical protein